MDIIPLIHWWRQHAEQRSSAPLKETQMLTVQFVHFSHSWPLRCTSWPRVRSHCCTVSHHHDSSLIVPLLIYSVIFSLNQIYAETDNSVQNHSPPSIHADGFGSVLQVLGCPWGFCLHLYKMKHVSFVMHWKMTLKKCSISLHKVLAWIIHRLESISSWKCSEDQTFLQRCCIFKSSLHIKSKLSACIDHVQGEWDRRCIVAQFIVCSIPCSARQTWQQKAQISTQGLHAESQLSLIVNVWRQRKAKIRFLMQPL